VIAGRRERRSGGQGSATLNGPGAPGPLDQLEQCVWIVPAGAAKRAVRDRRRASGRALAVADWRLSGTGAVDRREPRGGEIHFVHTCAVPSTPRAPADSAESGDPIRSEQIIFTKKPRRSGAKPDLREALSPSTPAAFGAAKLASIRNGQSFLEWCNARCKLQEGFSRPSSCFSSVY
jgi:hypothetical protein